MRKILVVVDMQNDFITGPLGTPEAEKIVDKVVDKIKEYVDNKDMIFCTYDTHFKNYLETNEGKHLPVPHCIYRTEGWELHPKIQQVLQDAGSNVRMIFKQSFGSIHLKECIEDIVYRAYCNREELPVIEFVGVCTDICVVSNVLATKTLSVDDIYRYDPLLDVQVVVDASCCAGTTPEAHNAALQVMKSCQVDVIGEDI